MMFIKKVNGPRSVRLPNGKLFSLAELPRPDTQRWVASRKVKVVRAVLYGLMSQSDALQTYGLSEEEFFEWVAAVEAYGEEGLKVTKAPR